MKANIEAEYTVDCEMCNNTHTFWNCPSCGCENEDYGELYYQDELICDNVDRDGCGRVWRRADDGCFISDD